jgi:peptidoglycan/LPS O-acetylase OafA/YrhL
MLAVLLKGKVSHPAFLAIFLPSTVFLSWVFYICVESPFINLSHRVKARCTKAENLALAPVAGI